MTISMNTIEDGLYEIQHYLIKKHGTDVARRDLDPLEWYINTGRASTDFLRGLFSVKPFMIGRILHKSRTYEEAIENMKDYINAKYPGTLHEA